MESACLLPDIDEIDFSDVADINGYAALLYVHALRNAGSQAVTSRARGWVRAVTSLLTQFTPGKRLYLMEARDIAHRIAFGKPAPHDFVEKDILEAFSARIHGDTEVNEYHLYRAISGELRRSNALFFDKPLSWVGLSLSEWVGNFLQSGRNAELKETDAIQQAAILLGDDLSAFLVDQAAFKRNLLDAQTGLIDNPDSLDADSLEEMERLLTASMPLTLPDNYRRRREALQKAAVAHPATNRFRRAALRLSANFR